VGILVGREAQLAQIESALDDAAAGRGRLVLLAGEPGIGKTSLADAATTAAAARGFETLWGRCWEAGGAPAYWPWLDVLGALARLVEDAALAAALGDGAAALGELLPEVAARLPKSTAATPPGDEARFRLWRGVTGLVRVATRAPRGGLAVVLDDLHAADRSSLLLLHFLARELRSLRVLLVCTYRDAEARADAETGELLARVGREGTMLALPRLDREAAATFVRRRAGDVEPRALDQILERTQGNPLFLTELARLVAEGGAEAVVEGVVPQGVRDVIRQRLDRLGADARAVLELAAVAGDTLDVPLLVAASGRDAAAVARALDEATRAGVLAEGGARRRFGHALFREVLYRELGDAERRALHGRVAAALDPNASEAERAHHARLGPPELLPSAVEHAERAARRAQEVGAYDDAVSILEKTREAIAVAGNAPTLRARVLVALGEARIRRGDGAAGQAAAREAATAAAELGDAELGARAALAYGRVFTFAVVDPVLVGMLEESLEALPPGDSAVRARLLARLGAALQPNRKSAEPVGVALEAIATARRLGDPATLLEVLHDAISALLDMSDPAVQRALILEAERLALELSDRERLLRTHGRLVNNHLTYGELDAADARIDAFEALAAELKAPWTGWRAPIFRAVRASMHGRFDEAERLAAEGRRLGEAAGDPNAERLWTICREGILRTAHRHEDMLAHLPAVRRARADFTFASEWQSTSAVLTYARLEDPENTRLYLELIPDEARPMVDNLFLAYFLVDATALLGERALAARLYEQILGHPDEYLMLGMSYLCWEGPRARLLGQLAAALERWDDAFAHFEDAIARCRRLGVRPHLARALYDHGVARLRRGAAGDAERAHALLAEARTEAEALGMTGLVALVDKRAPAPSPATAPRPATARPTGPALAFTLEGEVWSIAAGTESCRLKDTLGLRYLFRLIAQPGSEVHVLDLVGERPATSGAPGEAIDLGDSGELLDDEARESYKRRLEDLKDTLEEAESFGDAARAARARAEMEALAGELGRAVGLGGRARRAGGAAERARSAVQRRIKNAIERIGEHAPDLAAYLSRTVRTGNFCIFRPEP
jgi:hypothetical protein